MSGAIYPCNSSNVIYLISCKNCEDQYIGSAKADLSKLHKSDFIKVT